MCRTTSGPREGQDGAKCLVDAAGWGNGNDEGAGGLGVGWLQGQLSEGLLILGEVLAEDVEEGFGLLGAEVDGLEVIRTTSSAESCCMVPKMS